MGKTRILVIDDEPALTRMLRCDLEAFGGYEVQVENHPLQGVEAARRFRPDLILLDVVMPDVDGGQVAAQLRDDEATRQIPIVFLTAITSRQEVRATGSLIGGSVFLPKPVKIDEIIACITQQLEQHPHRQEPRPPA